MEWHSMAESVHSVAQDWTGAGVALESRLKVPFLLQMSTRDRVLC